MHRLTFIILLFCLIKTVHVFSIPEYDISKSDVFASDFKVGLLVDPDQSYEIEDVAQRISSFKESTSRFYIKSINDTYWFAFKLKNSSAKKLTHVVGFDEVYMETADLYFQTDSGWYHEKNGLSQPIKDRKIMNRNPVFYVELDPNETKTIFLKMQSKFSLVAGLVVEDIPVFQQEEDYKLVGYWSYFGAALAILIYNIFLLIHIRERVYLYYIIYAICIIVFAFLYSGYSQYVNTSVKLHYVMHASIALMGAFISLFTRELLGLKSVSKWINNAVLINAGILFFIALLITIDIYFYQVLVLYGMPSMLFLLFVGIYCWIKNVTIARYYVVAMSSYLIGLVMIGALNMNLLPYNVVTRYGFLIGSFIELLLFSLALGYRIKLLQNEKNEYYFKLLETERSTKEILAIEVADRTEQLTNSIRELSVANNKLSKLSLFKEDMINMVIHDLKTPLSAIINADLIKDEKNRLYFIQQSGRNMLNMVQNILDVYRYENTEIDLNKQECLLSVIIEKGCNEIMSLARQKALRTRINSAVDCIVSIDLDIVSRIILNLLSNAVKFAPANSDIEIVISSKADNTVQVDVSNHGPAIPKHEQALIFEKFKQSKDGRSKNRLSTGLGLAFCKMGVEAHGGQIGVVSEGDKGVTFYFTLPNVVSWIEGEVNVVTCYDATLALTEQDRQYLSPLAKDLMRYKTFDVWEINNVLSRIEMNSTGVEKWLGKLEESIYTGDETKYEELLNSVI